MLRLTELAHHLCWQVLRPGDIAIDATVGNGHDTSFLADIVSPAGHVYGFDIQPAALELTRQNLGTLNSDCVTLLARSHDEMDECIPAECHGRVKLIMFNLGYLPGGNKDITTRTETTLGALESACGLLHPDGLISIIAYPGHAAGQTESQAVEDCLRKKEDEGWSLLQFAAAADNANAPRLFLLSPYTLTLEIPE